MDATSSASSSAAASTSLSPLSTTTYTPSTCLFCPHPSSTIETNVTHMSKSHNFYIPDIDHLIDISTFLTFLNTTISEFHECLFCGTTRSNRWATQDHMKSKGHCRIDLEDEWEECADFWEYPSDEEGDDEEEASARRVEDEGQLHLQSGKTLGHRSRARQFRQNPSQAPLSPPSPSRQLHSNRTLNPTQPSTSTALSIRAGTSTSLIGLPELQQRALRVVEKKTMQTETRAKNRYQSGVDRGGNCQKFFKVLRRLERVPGSV